MTQIVTNLNDINFDDFVKVSPKEKPDLWKEEDLVDYFGNKIKIGDRVLRNNEAKWNDYDHFKKCTVKEINLKREFPIGVITDGKNKIGWCSHKKLILGNVFKEKI